MSDIDGRAGSDAQPQDSVEPRQVITVKQVRTMMGCTQAELATAMGISAKAIQSYEQGWRDVPARVVLQLLALLALYRRQSVDDLPCWEPRKCNSDQKRECASFAVGRGQFCWFMGTEDDPASIEKEAQSLLPCKDCPVVKSLMSGGPRSED